MLQQLYSSLAEVIGDRICVDHVTDKCVLGLGMRGDAMLIEPGRLRVAMPFVTVHMYPGRTPAQKEAVVRGITDVLVREAGAKPESVEIILMEVPREHWAQAGKLQGTPTGATA
jgi:4-oxalocrotonate tautomerase